MPEVNPPLYLPLDAVYGADELALPYRDIMGEGVVGSGDLLVAPRAAGANRSVDVAVGAAWITGDDNPAAQGAYRARSDGVVNVAIGTNTSGQPRIDQIIARVYDTGFAGVLNKWQLEVLPGTPTAGATLANLTGAAALPNNAIRLAYVLAANAFATITATEILDARPQARIGGGAVAAGAFVKIADGVISGGQFDFQNIPQIFKTLQLVVSGRSDAANTSWGLRARLNGDTGGNYYNQDGAASAAVASAVDEVAPPTSLWVGRVTGSTASVGYFGATTILIPAYTQGTRKKAVVADSFILTSGVSGALIRDMLGGVWTSDNAITRVTVFPSSGNFITGSTCELYGII